MTNAAPAFTWSDAWLLFSIATSDDGRGAGLRSILAAGDWINHAIFTGPELRRGMAKLIQAGYVTENAGRFSLAGEAKAAWAETGHSPAADLKALEAFLEIASHPPQDPAFEDPQWPYPGLSDEMVRQAYREYIGKGRH